MKSLLSMLAVVAVFLVVITEGKHHATAQQRPHPSLSNFPGYGPFNPHAKPPPGWGRRFRRDNGQLHAHSTFVNGKHASTSLDYEKKVFENGYGTVTAYGGGNLNAGQRTPEAHGGVRGVFTFGGEGRVMSEDERLFNQVMEKHRRN